MTAENESVTQRREAYTRAVWGKASAVRVVDATMALADAELAALAADRDAQIEALQAEVEAWEFASNGGLNEWLEFNGKWRDRHIAASLESTALTRERDANRRRADAAESRARVAEGELRQVREAVGAWRWGWFPRINIPGFWEGLDRAVLASVPDGAGQPTPQAPTTTDEAPRGVISTLTCECCGAGCDCGCVMDCPAPDCRKVAASPVVASPAPATTDEEDPEYCWWSQRVDGKKHSWVFDGDSPVIVCHYCHESRDAQSGHVIVPARPAPVSGGGGNQHPTTPGNDTQDGDKR